MTTLIILCAIFTPITAMLFGITGIYRHYKGGLYLGLFRTWESDNDRVAGVESRNRPRRVIYFSLRELQLDDRTESEFLCVVVRPNGDGYDLCATPRFKRILPPWQPMKGALL